MKFKNCSYIDFVDKMKNKTIILAGASKYAITAASNYPMWFDKFKEQIKYVVDNDLSKQNQDMEIGGVKKPVKSLGALKKEQSVVILIGTSFRYVMEIAEQLEHMGLDNTNECYSLALLTDANIDVDFLTDNYFENKIQNRYSNEKIIHCCWFSGEPKPRKYQECIDSWGKFCPDYKVIEWTSDNYDFGKNRYLKEAYDSRAWAFASDYVRLDVVYQYGGIYMDMDVELFKPLDELLKYRAFFCFDWYNFIDLGSAFGAVKGDTMVKRLLDTYQDKVFLLENGERDKTPQPTRLRPYFEEMGLTADGRSQVIDDRVFLSAKYFAIANGMDIPDIVSQNQSYGVHWHNAGWFDEAKMKYKNAIMSKIDEMKVFFKYE